MKGWVVLVSWRVADGLPTLVVTHQLQVELRTWKVRQSETDVLPLCYATNYIWYNQCYLLTGSTCLSAVYKLCISRKEAAELLGRTVTFWASPVFNRPPKVLCPILRIRILLLVKPLVECTLTFLVYWYNWRKICLRCFDAVGWAARRATGL